jgi:hypothetical protein
MLNLIGQEHFGKKITFTYKKSLKKSIKSTVYSG